MSKGLRPAALQPDVARARLTEPGLPTEMRTSWGVYLLERAYTGLRLTVEAPTLARLFIDAARAMGDQLGQTTLSRPAEPHQLSVVAATADQLLAAWLGELLHCARQTRHLFGAIQIRRINSSHLRAELRDERETRWSIDPISISVADTRVATVTDTQARRFVAHIRVAAARRPPT
jgi:SHS2 domain-containing protein